MDLTRSIHSILIKLSFIVLTIYFFFALTNFKTIFFRSNYVLLLGLLLALSSLLFIALVNLKRVVIFSIVCSIILITILYYKIFPTSYAVNYDYTLLYVIFFLIAMGDIKISELLKISLLTKAILTGITICSYFIGLVPNSTLQRGDHLRQALGFAHPNLLGLIVLCLSIELLYLYFKKMNLVHFLLLFLLNLAVYLVTFSRTSFICSILVLLIFVLEKYTPILHFKYIEWLFILSVPIFFMLAVFPSLFYKEGNVVFQELNAIFSNRLSQGYFYIQEYGISLLGHPIPNVLRVVNPSNNWIEVWVLDSAYLRILIQHGIIVFLLIFLFILRRCIMYIKMDLLIEIALIVVCLIYGIFERYAFNIFIYTSPLVLFIVQGKLVDNKLNIFSIYKKFMNTNE